MNADIASTLAEIEYGLANFGEAKALLTSPPGVNKNSEAAYAYQLGRILFQMAELKEAEAQFERSVRAGSGSARDHALIWLATTQKRTGGLPPTFAETHAVSRVENTWPTPILQYLLGFKTEKELLDEARNSKDESTRKSRLCEAYYFIGMQQLSVGKTRDAKASFQRAIDTQVVEYIEYRGAKMELAKLNR
jgi:lipoprotein NlpI